MTDADLNAHACALAGWEYAPTTDGAKDRPWRNHSKMQRLAEHQLPSFLTGPEALGNVAGLEAKLIRLNDRSRYVVELWCVVSGQSKDEFNWPICGPNSDTVFALITATPHQRLLALLRVLKPELFQ